MKKISTFANDFMHNIVVYTFFLLIGLINWHHSIQLTKYTRHTICHVGTNGHAEACSFFLIVYCQSNARFKRNEPECLHLRWVEQRCRTTNPHHLLMMQGPCLLENDPSKYISWEAPDGCKILPLCVGTFCPPGQHHSENVEKSINIGKYTFVFEMV